MAFNNLCPLPRYRLNSSLTEGQHRAQRLICGGHNLFLTGKSGTGKTFALIDSCKKLLSSRRIAITSTTGIACLNFTECGLQAKTLHSFAGIKDGQSNANILTKLVQNSDTAVKRWNDIDLLVIDEVSMLSARLFEVVEKVARVVRNKKAVFGGIQVVAAGDFFQLPPVFNDADRGQGPEGEKFAFLSPVWSQVFSHSVYLEEVVRQKDPPFITFLNYTREATITEAQREYTKKYLSGKTVDPKSFGVDFVPDIFCTNEEVDIENFFRLEEMDEQLVVVNSIDSGNSKLLNR